jgi:hypothetical protein
MVSKQPRIGRAFWPLPGGANLVLNKNLKKVGTAAEIRLGRKSLCSSTDLVVQSK